MEIYMKKNNDEMIRKSGGIGTANVEWIQTENLVQKTNAIRIQFFYLGCIYVNVNIYKSICIKIVLSLNDFVLSFQENA